MNIKLIVIEAEMAALRWADKAVRRAAQIAIRALGVSSPASEKVLNAYKKVGMVLAGEFYRLNNTLGYTEQFHGFCVQHMNTYSILSH